MIANVLSIAGSDPSGGAGLQADLKTFGALGCHGMAAPTALTVQNTQGVAAIHLVPPDFVAAQIDHLFADIRIDAIKIGMTGSTAIVAAIAKSLAAHPDIPVVVDPVLVATSGDVLGGPDLAGAILRDLTPRATLVTPNLAEAATLSGLAPVRDLAGMEVAGMAILARGAAAVLVKGGHLDGAPTDLLCTSAGRRIFTGDRIATRNTHGTGCSLSAAIAAFLAQGRTLDDAIAQAKTWLAGALASADRLSVGAGPGPVDHFHAPRRERTLRRD